VPTGGAVLKRLTVLASSPDDNVMLLQADFADINDSLPARIPVTAPKSLPYDRPAPTRSSGYRTPIEQYASTRQGAEAGSAAPLLDVRA
jgi:hypothetical protein